VRSSLRKCFFEAVVKSAFDGPQRKFIPHNSLTELVTEDSVMVELQFDQARVQSKDAELVKYICSNSIKIFATAVYMRCTGAQLRKMMQRVQKHAITDDDLPLQLENSESKWKSLRWSKYTQEDFYDAQWLFLAPVFSGSRVQYDLAPDCVLPFLKTEEKDARQHTFGSITKVRIHTDHFATAQQTVNNYVAVKQISAQFPEEDDLSWNAEYEALSEVTALNHPHILDLIAAIKRGHDRYFLFSWADGGSLRELWHQHRYVTLNTDVVRESISQLRGLADALDRVHDLGNHGDVSMRHGDLKPENIMVFPDNSIIGNLKIGDWGLAKKHVVGTEERRYQTSMRYGTALYEAPEAVRRDLGGGRSRLYDIWAFGCVALEHVIWLLYGEDEHGRFLGHLVGTHRDSGFYKLTGEGVIVHPEVVRWMDCILMQFPVGTSVGDIVEIIRTKLLVVELPPVHLFAKPLELPNNTAGENVQQLSTNIPRIEAPMDYTSSTTALSIQGKQPNTSERIGPYRARAKDIVSCFDLILHQLEMDGQYCFLNRPYNALTGPPEYSAPPMLPRSQEFKKPKPDFLIQVVRPSEARETSPQLPGIEIYATPLPVQEHHAPELGRQTEVTRVCETSDTTFRPSENEVTRFVSSPIRISSDFRARTERLYRGRSNLKTFTEYLGSSPRMRAF
jgi:serine/threonine protein kinase